MSKRNKGHCAPHRVIGPSLDELVDIEVVDRRPPQVEAKPLSTEEAKALFDGGFKCPRCGNGRKNAKTDGIEVWWCA